MADRCDNAPCGLIDFADDGTILHVNETLAGWLGLAPDALIGRKFESILTLANRVFLQTHFYPLLRLQGQAEEIFLALHKSDGASIPVVAAAHRHPAPEGTVIQCALLAVPQRRKYEDEILQAKRTAEEALRNNEALQAVKAELEVQTHELERKLGLEQVRTEELQRAVQILSHDLREPLRKIGLFADLVRGPVKTLDDLEPVEALRKIEVEAARMDGLLQAMRELLEPDSVGGIEKIKISEVVERAASTVALRMGFSDWTVVCEPLPEIEGRRSRLLLLLSHLLENCIKFREPSRHLRVRVRGRVVQENVFAVTKARYHYADFAQIEVEDNGTGFDPKYRDYVFRLLKKVHLVSPGLGVGLAVCRKIVSAHYGTIRVEPRPGEGTTFTLLLPVQQPLPPMVTAP